MPRLSTKKLKVFPFWVMDPSYKELDLAREYGVEDVAYKTIDCANDFAYEIGHIANQANKQRIEIQRIEHTFDNVHEVTQSDYQLEVHIDICDGDVDFLDRNLHTSIDLHETCDLGIEVEICLQLLYNQLDPSNVEFWNLEKNIWRATGAH